MEKRNIVIIICIAIIAIIALCGCGPTEKEFEDMVNQRVATALETAEKARRAKPQVIEVRIPEEYSNAVIQRVVVTNTPSSSASNNGDIRTPVQVKIDEHIKKHEESQKVEQKAEAKDADNKVPEIVKLGSLDEYRTLEVLRANELFAKQEVEAVEKQLTTLKEGKASLEKQISEKKGNEVTRQRLQIIDFQLQLENSKLEGARKYLQEKTNIRQQAEEALQQRDKAVAAAKAAKHAWYNPKGWWN